MPASLRRAAKRFSLRLGRVLLHGTFSFFPTTGSEMKLKRIILGLSIAMLSGVALAQTILPPNLRGTWSERQADIAYIGMLRLGLNGTLTALAGGAQVGAAPLNLGMNRFTTVVTGGDSAILPLMTGAVVIMVVNATANSMNVFPNVGGTINALSANTAFAVAAGKTAIFVQAVDGGTWYALLSA